MVDATVFVAVAIGSVLGLLLLSVTLMYCMKRHHDKQQNRELIERRRLEERHHRHLVSLRVAQPPPYDSRRENVLTMVQGPVPFSPPPAYKERITPLPPRNGQDGLIVGIGGTTGYGAHQSRTSTVGHHNSHRHSQNRNNAHNNNRNSNNVNSRNNMNVQMSNSNSNQAMVINAPVDVHSSARRNHSEVNHHRAQRVQNNRQQLPEPPRHDPPSYSSLQIRRPVDNNDSNSISTISINSPSQDNSNNSGSSSSSQQRNNTSNERVSSSRAQMNNNNTSNNIAESRTALERDNRNGASTSIASSSSDAHRRQVVTNRSHQSSSLNTMPEIEDLSLI